MLRFPLKRPRIGLEIQTGAIRLAVVAGAGSRVTVLYAGETELPESTVNDGFFSRNINDPDKLAGILQECLNASPFKAKRAALSLPDSVFRVQTLDFDELPRKKADVSRLIKWRLEKTAAFETAGTVLRHQIIRRSDRGYTALVCAARADVISQYENALLGLGLEPWAIGLSSFHAMNFYSAYMTAKSPLCAYAHVAADSFSLAVLEKEGPRFYRFKEIKKGDAGEMRERVVREIDDSLHFFTHMDRSQPAEVGHLYLAGTMGELEELAKGLTALTSLNVEKLTPESVFDAKQATERAKGLSPEMAAAIGAGAAV